MSHVRPDHSFDPHFLTPQEESSLFSCVNSTTSWRHDTITLYGREHLVPRLTALFGDPGVRYTYSRITMEPSPWTKELSDLRQRLEGVTERPFNAVLANLYRDGRDANGWHADDEPELGDEPFIASLSLGAPRDMRFRHRATGSTWTLTLTPGSLLLMYGDSQRDWQHCIPRRAVAAPRINLTFRQIMNPTMPRSDTSPRRRGHSAQR